MLTRLTNRLSLREQHGFTLIEVLVASVTGVIVAGALFTILDVSVRQSSRISESAASTQRGRVTMTRIQDMLHSACVSPKFTPVEAGSTESKLVFINAYGEQAAVPSTWTTREVTEGAVKTTYLEGVRKDEIAWNEGAQTLVDTYALGSGESAGKYTFGATKTMRLGEFVSKIPSTPIFQYYEYATTASSSTSAASATLVLKKPPVAGFTEAEANKIAAVTVSFNTAPDYSATTATKRLKEGRTADLSSSTTLAFSAPNSEATITAGPCE